ncbi:hypothetical protein R515_14560 [Salmonella enterica subsp. arizonae serovar 41:z4,z23:-]|nr:hypothetical protein [Salmonella enterica]EDO3524992.1 hypothetical protein [Salmonella enterica]MIP66467.1 hypothetical protein [Salmonella enterica]OSE57769.1 hypothetical protein R515_14560 [Salmonella enterica subsp. arizonae serovar 41:z4,z23:-]
MLHDVTGARSVGSAIQLRNQTSGESIGLTSLNVASMCITFFNSDLRNEIWLAKSRDSTAIRASDFCFRSFLSVISVT